MKNPLSKSICYVNYVYLKLQEIKERVVVTFGGVSIFNFGDLRQLKPVMGAFIFDIPFNPKFHATFKLKNRWEMFKVLNLEVNHIQGEDKPYADMLNRIRIGQITDEDIAKLQTRVRTKNQKLAEVSLYIFPTKLACVRYNTENT